MQYSKKCLTSIVVDPGGAIPGLREIYHERLLIMMGRCGCSRVFFDRSAFVGLQRFLSTHTKTSFITLTRKIKKPIKLTPFPDGWLIAIVVTGVLFLVAFDLYRATQNKKQDKIDCRAERNRKIAAKIKKAFLDDNPNHKGFVIQFTNGEEYRPRFLPRWQSLTFNEGDSINKESGTFRYVLYSNGYDKPIVVEDSVNCDEQK